jgi:hypothetical protein
LIATLPDPRIFSSASGIHDSAVPGGDGSPFQPPVLACLLYAHWALVYAKHSAAGKSKLGQPLGRPRLAVQRHTESDAGAIDPQSPITIGPIITPGHYPMLPQLA